MLHQLVEKNAIAHPHQNALQFHDETLTYEQLNVRANQLAYVLLSEGIAPQDYVIANTERSIDQVVVFLALLKIGAIYVPLSTDDHPESRLQQMVKDCSPKLIITNSDRPELKISSAMPRSFDMRSAVEQINAASKENPNVAGLHNSMIAYTAYSSGTTGQPKGIPIRHNGMIEYWKPVLEANLTHKAPHVLANVSTDFDAHIWEYLMAWTFASTLHLTDKETRKDSEKLAEFITRHQITDMTLTPAVLRTFTDEQVEVFSTSLKAVYSTGEACTTEIVRKYDQYEIGIWNCYGPTEATFGLSMVRCELNNFHKQQAPIGLPPLNSGVTVTIVNETGAEVADGEAGELVIHSPYLTPGYLNVESKSFTNENLSYNTGDRFVKQGTLLYCHGRLNALSHIKIRGQFVDVAGVENTLREFPSVQDACVILRDDIAQHQEPILVAFVVYQEPSMMNMRALRAHCATKLSDFSIPTFFMSLDSMPLMTGSDKVDRKALANKQITFERDQSTVSYTPPASTLEQELVAIWKEVLYSSKDIEIGITDVFYEIGGNSINAIYLARKLKEKYDVSLSLGMLHELEQFTIQHLAVAISKELAKKERLECVKSAKKDDTTPLFLLPPLSGESSSGTYNPLVRELTIPQRVYYLDAPTSGHLRSSRSIADLADFYLGCMLAEHPKGPLHIVGWSSGGLLAYEIARQAEERRIPVEFVGIIDEPVPSFVSEQDPESFAKALIKLVEHFSARHHFSVDIDDVATLARMSKEEQIKTVFKKIQACSLSPVSRSIMDYVENFLLANIVYHPNNRLQKTPLTVFITSETQREHAENKTASTALAWAEYSNARVTVHEVHGDHFSIMREPTEIADKISQCVHPQTPKKKEEMAHDTSALPTLDLSYGSQSPLAERKDATTETTKSYTHKVSSSQQNLQKEQPHKKQVKREFDEEQKVQTPQIWFTRQIQQERATRAWLLRQFQVEKEKQTSLFIAMQHIQYCLYTHVNDESTPILTLQILQLTEQIRLSKDTETYLATHFYCSQDRERQLLDRQRQNQNGVPTQKLAPRNGFFPSCPENANTLNNSPVVAPGRFSSSYCYTNIFNKHGQRDGSAATTSSQLVPNRMTLSRTPSQT